MKGQSFHGNQLGLLTGTNSFPLAALPKDDGCKSAGHHPNAAICQGSRSTRELVLHLLITRQLAGCILRCSGALQAYSDAHE